MYSSDGDLDLHDAACRALLPSSETGWHRIREVAESRVLHDLEVGWYRRSADGRGIDWRTNPLDPSRLEPSQLKMLSVLGTLAAIYESQGRPGREPDGLERRGTMYRNQYKDELKSLVGNGVDYDWNGVGGIEPSERATRQPRRLGVYKR